MTTSLTTTTTPTLTVPSYLESNSGVGLEHFSPDDVAMPRLSLAQAMSDQVNPTHAERLEGLEVGDFFNSVSGIVYGHGPLRFSILCSYPPRGIEFAPMEQGGGVVDRSVPLNDPRMMFGANGEAPQATRFYDYVLMLDPGEREEMISMSLARSGVKAAKSLNGLARMRGSDIYTGIYTAESVPKTTQQGSYMTWRFRNDGFIAEELVERYRTHHVNLKTRQDSPEVTAEVVSGSDPTPF
jgi:hypothetical protein